jgi:hypothetical protein
MKTKVSALKSSLYRIIKRHQPLPPPHQMSRAEYLANKELSEYPLRGYSNEEEARQALKAIDNYTMISYERMVTLWQQVRYLDRAGIVGSLVECGTWKGGACGLMALAHKAHGPPTRSIHLFDSFEGLPEPDATQDGNAAVHYASYRASGKLQSINQCVATLEENQHVMKNIADYPEELTIYHVGWFQETLPAAAPQIGGIALLRLDGDWYESTKVCLDILYPQVVSGGIVVIDDYGRWEGARRAVDEFLAYQERCLMLHHIDASGRYFVKESGI